MHSHWLFPGLFFVRDARQPRTTRLAKLPLCPIHQPPDTHATSTLPQYSCVVDERASSSKGKKSSLALKLSEEQFIEEENEQGRGATASSTPRRDPAPEGGGRAVESAAAAGEENLNAGPKLNQELVAGDPSDGRLIWAWNDAEPASHDVRVHVVRSGGLDSFGYAHLVTSPAGP